MRADRLIATVLLLQSRERVTAAEVADELEVSVATARRDLEALSAAGVPVYAQPGRHGGWALVGGARTDLTGLTSTEARALFERLGTATSDPTLVSALRKILRALPQPFREEADRARLAVAADPTSWGRSPTRRPEAVDELLDAVVTSRQVAFCYTRRSGVTGTVQASPVGVVDKLGTWYLVANREVGVRRTYRVDRLTDLRVLDEASIASSAASATLEEEWQRVVTDVEATRSSCAATIRLAVRFRWIIEQQFGPRHVTVTDGPDAAGLVTLEVRASIPLDIARQLAGWGSAVELLGPQEVRDELTMIARELAATYLDGPNL